MIAYVLMELTDSTLVAPGISLATFSGLMLLAARTYKDARNIDVQGERDRRIKAEERERETGASTASKLEALSQRVKSLEGKIDEMRAEHEQALLNERGKNFQLRAILRDNGIQYPPELGPSI